MAETSGKLKTYDELTFSDDFMFCKVLQNNPGLCRELTELILGREIGSIVQMEKQHPIEITANGHGVRFDIYMKDDKNTLYDIEMQNVTLPELPKRARYYHSMMDLESLERGVSYRNLPGSCVIFICMENPFARVGLHKYTFRNSCEEHRELRLEDMSESIFLSATGNADDVSDEMKSFLRYLTEHTAENDFTRRLENAVQKAKERRDWSVEYMNLYEIKELEREEGRRQGKEEGLKEGIPVGEDRGRILVYHEEMHLTPQQIAEKIGKTQEYVTGVLNEIAADKKA